MSYRVELTPAAERAIRRLDPERLEVVAERLRALGSWGIPRSLRVSEADPDDGEGDRSRVAAVPAGDHVLLCQERKGVVLVVALRGLVEKVDASEPPPSLYRPKGRLRDLAADLWADVRFAVRSFRRNPAFALVTVAVLALGLGANTALFSVFHNVFLAPLPFADGDRMVRIRDYRVSPGGDVLRVNNAPRNALAIRERNRVFSGVVAQRGTSATLTAGGEPFRAGVIDVTRGWTEVLGLDVHLGRGFTEEEERLGRESGVVLMAHGLWESRFGSDPSVVGRTIGLNGRPVTVVGVMPPRFRYPYTADLWRPALLDPNDGVDHSWNVVGRLRDGASLEDARRDLDRIALQLEAEHPETNEGIGIGAEDARENFVQDQDRIVVALLGAVGFLLLIACLNVANLLTARFLVRGREIGIRAALGAGRGRQLRQFVTETLLLFLAGGAAGFGLAYLVATPLADLVPSVLAGQLDLADVTPGPTVAAFTAVLSLVTGLVFGGLAAIRGSATDLRSLLVEGGRGRQEGAGRGLRLLDGLVVAEVALAMALLTGAGLMTLHLHGLRAEDPGFTPENLTTLRIDLAGTSYTSPDARTGLTRTLEERLEAVSGVREAGITTVNPLCCGDWGARVLVEGMEVDAEDASIVIHHRLVSPGLHDAMDIPLVRGRLLRPSDVRDAPPVAVVDERLARRFWPGENPIGKRIKRAPLDSDTPWRTVVGVVGAVEDAGDYTETWYIPYAQDPTGRSSNLLHLMVRTEGEANVGALRSAVAEVDPGLALYGVRTMEGIRAENLASDELGTQIVVGLGALGLALAAFGLYGLMSYLVGRRSRELAVRRALGAGRGGVLLLVLRDSAALLGVGLALGTAGSLLLARVLGAVIPGIGSPGPALLGPAAAVLLLTGLLATLVPALRAARIDPAGTLRG